MVAYAKKTRKKPNPNRKMLKSLSLCLSILCGLPVSTSINN